MKRGDSTIPVKENLIYFETNRLILRQWQPDDYAPFAEINSDPDVMKYFPNTLSRMESNVLAEKMQNHIENNGWGMWPVALKSTGKFIGFVGLNRPMADLPPSPCVEIGWRLGKNHWGNGYVTEAARWSLNYAFNTLELDEVVAFTTLNNKRSIAVMDHIGMTDTGLNFMHPNINKSSNLCEHILYKITRNIWMTSRC